MDVLTVQEKSRMLIEFIESLPDFTIENEIDERYEHMGATITDAILQAGINYKTVVKPRVERLRNSFPSASTTSGFLELATSRNIHDIVNFRGVEPDRILAVTHLFKGKGVECEDDLREWLKDLRNISMLKSISGIGAKTVDYFKILVGFGNECGGQAFRNFIRNAGMQVSGYKKRQEIINQAADVMNIRRAVLDHSIWKYMSEKKRGVGE